MAYDIFISYRREGGKDKARALKGELELKKFNVFLDFDELKDGKFDKRIMDAIDQASVFIFLMTPHSLDRCVNEDDWVRKEIEYATKRGKTILPVNVDMEFSEFPKETPASVKEALGAHTFVDIHFGSTFKDLVEKMVNERINAVIRKRQQMADQPKEGAEIHVNTEENCKIYDYGKKIGELKKGDNVIYLKRGRHQLKFEAKYDCVINREYDVAANDMVSSLDIKWGSSRFKYNLKKLCESDTITHMFTTVVLLLLYLGLTVFFLPNNIFSIWDFDFFDSSLWYYRLLFVFVIVILPILMVVYYIAMNDEIGVESLDFFVPLFAIGVCLIVCQIYVLIYALLIIFSYSEFESSYKWICIAQLASYGILLIATLYAWGINLYKKFLD